MWHISLNTGSPDKYQPLDEEIGHLEVLLDLLGVFTSESKYAEVKDALLSRQNEGDEVTICSIVEKFTNDALDRVLNRVLSRNKNK